MSHPSARSGDRIRAGLARLIHRERERTRPAPKLLRQPRKTLQQPYAAGVSVRG